jgi:hypothetical protein
MSHGPEHQIEHAEHAVHAAGDDFNRMVTMSIAIVAAVLACVSMLGHRAHNETLLIQGEALKLQGEALLVHSEALQLQTLASIKRTDAANEWAFYQSKNTAHRGSKNTLDLLKVVSLNEKSQDDIAQVRKEHQDYVKKYDKKLPEIANKAGAIEKEADDFMKTSIEKTTEGQTKMRASAERAKDSHRVHAKSNRFDLGELGLQFGVVLCSLAILSKNRWFWLAGLFSSLVGTLVALSGQFELFIGGHH